MRLAKKYFHLKSNAVYSSSAKNWVDVQKSLYWPQWIYFNWCIHCSSCSDQLLLLLEKGRGCVMQFFIARRMKKVQGTPCRNIKEFWQMWHHQKSLTGLPNGGLWENIFWSVWNKIGNVCQNLYCRNMFCTRVIPTVLSFPHKDDSDNHRFSWQISQQKLHYYLQEET